MEKKRKGMSTHELVTLALLCAIGIVVNLLMEFPLLPAAEYLKYDPADIPILIGTMMFGPAAGVIMSFVISLTHTLLHGHDGPFGAIMHFAASAAMALVVGLIFKRKKNNTKNMVLSLILGSLAMTIVMVAMNLVITPLYNPAISFETVAKMIVPVTIPFNLIKATINSVLTALLYKALRKVPLFEQMTM